MRKIWLLPLIFLLAACAAGGGAPSESQTISETDQASSQSGAPTVVSSTVSAPAEPLNNDITIGQNAAEASAVRERDWVEGAADPLVTIIEYGDFQ